MKVVAIFKTHEDDMLVNAELQTCQNCMKIALELISLNHSHLKKSCFAANFENSSNLSSGFVSRDDDVSRRTLTCFIDYFSTSVLKGWQLCENN